MIVLITGASHTGKTALAQKLLEKILRYNGKLRSCRDIFDWLNVGNLPMEY